jgi:hypothetical protein
LGRDEFVDRFVQTCRGGLVEDTVMAVVDWSGAVGALEAGRLGCCSGSEAAVLRIAASLAAGTAVDLGEALTGLDGTNLALIAEAVMHAGGRRRGFSTACDPLVQP